jgi:type 1 glutamine amidotransferase
VKGFQHDSVSHALGTIWKIGQESGLYDTYIRTDTQLITKKKLDGNAKNLDFFDAIFFYTTGELAMDEQQKADFLSFIRDDGKGFLGAHSANDTFYKWPEYGEMIGGYFDLHPWNQFQAPIIVEDLSFPGMQQFPPTFTIHDEIYQVKDFSRERVRVLMRLDADKVDLKTKGVHRTNKDFAVTCRNYGNRVFTADSATAIAGPPGCPEDVAEATADDGRFGDASRPMPVNRTCLMSVGQTIGFCRLPPSQATENDDLRHSPRDSGGAQLSSVDRTPRRRRGRAACGRSTAPTA